MTTKRSAGVAPEVNLRKCVTCTPLLSTNKAVYFDFENQKSKTGVLVASQKGFMSPKYFFLKKHQQRKLYIIG